jgi:hypothetical protein
MANGECAEYRRFFRVRHSLLIIHDLQKKKTPAFLHGVFRRGENAPLRKAFQIACSMLCGSLLISSKGQIPVSQKLGSAESRTKL